MPCALLGSVALHCAMHAPGPSWWAHPQPTSPGPAEPRPEPAMADR